MAGFDDIFESIDDITAPPEEEREELTVSEAEAVTGVWNANDDGNVWSSGSSSPRPTGGMTKRAWNTNDDDGKQQSAPISGKKSGPKITIPPVDDWASEDEILEDFVDDPSDGGGGGAFDDIF